jgi:hypothetical protein
MHTGMCRSRDHWKATVVYRSVIFIFNG